jgi:hypothetical protein
MFHMFSPQPGDIISLKAPNARGVFWVASVGRSSREGTAIKVLAKADSRPRKVRDDDFDPDPEPIVLSPVQFRACDARVIRCGAPPPTLIDPA